ncbi:hypothetical protein YC2023_088305 [Brassica napus]
MVEKLAQKSVGAIDLVAHQLFDQMCLRGRRENQQKIVLMGKGLSGLSLCVRVWEPGGVFVKLAKWNRLETCHVYGWLMRVIGVGDVKFVEN